MPVNVKLALKVLREMEADFIQIEASLAMVQDEAKKIELFRQVREKRQNVANLKDYYSKLLTRQS